MLNKIASISVWILMSAVMGLGQSAFQGLTPGASARNDVAEVFGQPARTISPTLFEYNPPAGIAKVEVQYRAGSAIADRIEVYFVNPISRQALIQKLGLPPQAAARKPNDEERLVEYFGGPYFLALTYAAADESSGVSRIGYYSPELFARVVSLPQPQYPPLAKAARVAGTVSVQVAISEEGKVTSARAVSGPPLLVEASVKAAEKATFSPTLLNGKPVKIEGVINYTFVIESEGNPQ